MLQPQEFDSNSKQKKIDHGNLHEFIVELYFRLYFQLFWSEKTEVTATFFKPRPANSEAQLTEIIQSKLNKEKIYKY